MTRSTNTPRFFVATCALLLAATSIIAQDDLRNVKHGEMLPSYELTCVDGTIVTSEERKDKVVVLIYLSAEQRSSERAVSDANRVIKELERDDVDLIFLTADWIHRAYFESLWDELGVQAPLAFDAKRSLYKELGLIVFPTTIIVDREGRLSHVISTRPADYARILNAYIRHALQLLTDEELQSQLTARSFDKGSPKSLASRHRAAARLLRHKGLLESAEQELIAALKLNPENIDIQLDMADLKLRLNKLDEAESAINAVIAAEPKHRRAMLLFGILLLQNDRLDEAESALTQTLVLNPDPARTHFYLGLLYEKRGEKDRAIEHYRQALKRLLDENLTGF